MSDKKKAKLKIKMKAKMDANRIGRGNMEVAYKKLEEIQEKIKEARGDKKHYFRMFANYLEDILEKKEESIANMQFGDCIDGGVGFSSGGGSGNQEG